MVWRCFCGEARRGCVYGWVCGYGSVIDNTGGSSDVVVTEVIFDVTLSGRYAVVTDIIVTDCYRCAAEVGGGSASWLKFVRINAGGSLPEHILYDSEMKLVRNVIGAPRPALLPYMVVSRWDSDFRTVYRFFNNYITSYLALEACCPAGKVCAFGAAVCYCRPESPVVRIEKVVDIPTLKELLRRRGIAAGLYSVSDGGRQYIDIVVDSRDSVDDVLDLLEDEDLRKHVVSVEYG